MTKPPNLLILLTDQHYAGAMSCAGNPDLKTPAMDRLAEQGCRFDRAYCAHPLCGPSRAAVMTGVMPHQNGVTSNSAALDTRFHGRGLGNLLGRAGYRCALAGKWHVPGVTPAGMGFEQICEPRDDQVASRVLDYIERPGGQPYLVVASYVNPHDVCQAARYQPLPQGPVAEPETIAQCPGLPANFPVAPYAPDILQMVRRSQPRSHLTLDYGEDDWRRLRYMYYRLVEKVDAEIGRLLDGLRQRGLEEETAVILTSDHGEGHGAHHWNQKTALYEEVINVPFLVRCPGAVKPGVDRTHLVSTGLDLLPTCCDWAGVEPPAGLDGMSVRSLAEGRGAASWREELVVETVLPTGGQSPVPGSARALQTGRHKYSVYPIGRHREQLVDLQEDRGEMVNLAVQARCRGLLEEHRRRLHAVCERTDDPFLKEGMVGI